MEGITHVINLIAHKKAEDSSMIKTQQSLLRKLTHSSQRRAHNMTNATFQTMSGAGGSGVAGIGGIGGLGNGGGTIGTISHGYAMSQTNTNYNQSQYLKHQSSINSHS